MKLFIFIVTYLSLFLAISTHASDCDNGLRVTGKSIEKVKPDIAYVTVYAQAEGLPMEDAVKKANKWVEEISASAKADSTIIKQIEVTDVVIGEAQSEYWRSDQKDETARPQIIKRIRFICTSDPDGIYKVVDKAIRPGALLQLSSSVRYSNDVLSVVAYGVENSEQVISRLTDKAITEARSKAGRLAALAGKKVGSIVGIGCSNSDSIMEQMRFMGQLPDFPTEYVGLNSEEITIHHSIHVSFELID